MKLVKYNPNTLSLFNWDDIIDRFFDDDINFTTNFPAVDIREENDKYLMEVELPGLTEKDIELKVEGNLLTLSSRKYEKKEEKKKDYILKERRRMSFSRSFTLPEGADRDNIQAEFKNGLLKILLAKKPAAKPKLISINN